MAVRSHLIEHRCSVPWTLIAALIHLDQKRFSIFNTALSSVRSWNGVRPQKELCANSLDLLELNVAASRAQPRNR
jgi:hypothetical protein